MRRILTFTIISIGGWCFTSCLQGVDDLANLSSQFQSDTTKISTYVHGNFPNAIKMNTGVWYTTETVGSGLYATLNDTITYTYVVRDLASNTIYKDQSTEVSSYLNDQISGWRLGFPKWKEGSVGRLFVPSGLAYGSNSAFGLPSNSNVIFEVHLSKVSGYQTRDDTTKIAQYLRDNSVTNIVVDESGIRYKINSPGAGAFPSVSDVVTVTFSGQLLVNGDTFANVTSPSDYYLPDLVTSWGIILPKIPVGTTFTMYVPSGLAFGPATNITGIPANANLIFHIQLISSRH